MRVMLDTNILISALLFPSEQIELFFQTVTERDTVVLSSYVVHEFHHVVQRKFPKRQEDVDRFLSHFAFELVYTPEFLESPLIPIRDSKDYSRCNYSDPHSGGDRNTQLFHQRINPKRTGSWGS